jgi:hypothetical protein
MDSRTRTAALLLVGAALAALALTPLGGREPALDYDAAEPLCALHGWSETTNEPRAPVAAPTVEPPKFVQTAENYLQDLYGAQWKVYRERLNSQQLRMIQRPMDPANLPPSWEDASAELRERALIGPENLQFHADASIDWRADLYDSWDKIREVFHEVPLDATPEQLEAFREYARPIDDRLRDLAAQRTAILADVQAYKWESNDFDRAPIVCAPTPYDSNVRRSVHTTACGAGNQWSMVMHVFEDEMPPAFAALELQIRDELAARMDALRTYIKSL